MKIRFKFPKSYPNKQKVLDLISTYSDASAQMQNSPNYAHVPVAKRRRLEKSLANCKDIGLASNKQQLIASYHELLYGFGFVYEEMIRIVTGQQQGAYKLLPEPLRSKLTKALKQCEKLIEDDKASKAQLSSSVFELQKSFYAAYLNLIAAPK